MRLAVALVKCAGTAGLFYIILRQIDTRDILQRIAAIDGPLLAVVAVVLAVQQYAHAWRWRQIVRRVCHGTASTGELFRLLGAGQLYGHFMPLGTDLVRIGMLGRRVGLGPASLSVVIDRLSGLIALMLLMLIVLPLLYWRTGRLDVALLLGLSGGVALAGIAIVATFEGRLATSRLPGAIARVIDRIREARAAIVETGTASVIIAGGLVLQLFSVMLIYLLARATAVPLGAIDCLLIVPPALLLASLPVSIGGWGLREAAMATGFALVGVATADAVAVSVLYGLTAPVIGIAYGIFSLVERASQ